MRLRPPIFVKLPHTPLVPLPLLHPSPVLPQVYWVDVDYLQLAAAAAQCGAHFTALLYIEAWQEEQHGWLAPLDTAAASAAAAAAEVAAGPGGNGSGSGAGAPNGSTKGSTGQRQVAAVERLLLDTYSQINEPDGIYAVARSHSMLSQVSEWAYHLSVAVLALGNGLGGVRACPCVGPAV